MKKEKKVKEKKIKNVKNKMASPKKKMLIRTFLLVIIAVITCTLIVPSPEPKALAYKDTS